MHAQSSPRPPTAELNPVGAVLAEVRDMGPVTAARIADGTGLSISTVRRALALLEDTGYVESENYQRRAHVWIATDPRREDLPPARTTGGWIVKRDHGIPVGTSYLIGGPFDPASIRSWLAWSSNAADAYVFPTKKVARAATKGQRGIAIERKDSSP
jgi:DNA-binding transcriptional ArsR family regulator